MNFTSGTIFPSPDILNEFPEGKFVLSNLAAKRAKQIKEGAPPLVRIESNHPLTIALAEIAAGKIRPILGKEETDLSIGEARDLPILSDEPLPGELGILLPALDETEAEILGVGALVADEHDDHEEEIVPVVGGSLADLLDEAEPDVEPVAPEAEEGTLSLSEIADQENIDEEEETHE